MELPEPYNQDPERYKVLSNGAIYDQSTKRITAGAGSVPVPPERDTRITADRSHKQSGTALNKARWNRTREAVREAIVAQAIKDGTINSSQGAADVIAAGVAAIWTESTKKEHKLGDRIKAQQHIIRIAEPGLLLDERQRSVDLLPAGMRIDISEATAKQLFGTLRGVVGDVVEGESRELDE